MQWRPLQPQVPQPSQTPSQRKSRHPDPASPVLFPSQRRLMSLSCSPSCRPDLPLLVQSSVPTVCCLRDLASVPVPFLFLSLSYYQTNGPQCLPGLVPPVLSLPWHRMNPSNSRPCQLDRSSLVLFRFCRPRTPLSSQRCRPGQLVAHLDQRLS